MQQAYECIVIGGGPAGSTTATLLAQHGRRVLLLERARFPRHHIGESLMPQTYWTFKRLGMLEKLKATAFPLKESVQFVSADGRESQPFFFSDRDPNEWSVTWQVPRGKFDQMMLENAREHGVEVREGVPVAEVLFEDRRAVGVRTRGSDGTGQEIRGGVIVDATGNSGLISRQLNLRRPDEGLKKAAIYAYFRGAFRDEGRNAGATIIIHIPNREGWFWFIPLPGDIMSVGVVGSPNYLCTARGDDPLATLQEEIANCPAAQRRLEKAELVSPAYVTSDFSYRSSRLAGDGWILVGDAFCFLDPIYSSGVMFALQSGTFAADTIHDALKTGDCSGRSLGRFGPKLATGIQLLRQLVYAFYDRKFSFAEFLRKHPEHHDRLVRLLIGDVFNDEVAVIFDDMKNWTQLPQTVLLHDSQVSFAYA